VTPSSPVVAASPLCSLFVTCCVQVQKKNSKGHYNSTVLCSKSLSSAGRIRPGKDFVLKCRSRVESSGMMCTAGAKLIPRKQHTKLTAFKARVSIAQWFLPFVSVCVRSTPFIDDVEEWFWASIAENLRHCIQRCFCWSLRGATHPVPHAKAARANYKSNLLCSKSLSNAAEDEARGRI
jgi:hypothetical protein